MESHTSGNLRQHLSDMIRSWNLDTLNMDIIFTTDNGRNIVKAIELEPGWERIPCFNHTLQLAIRDVEKEIHYEQIASKVRKLVGFFKRYIMITLLQ